MSTNNGLPLFIEKYYFVHANHSIMHNKLLSCGIQLQIKMTQRISRTSHTKENLLLVPDLQTHFDLWIIGTKSRFYLLKKIRYYFFWNEKETRSMIKLYSPWLSFTYLIIETTELFVISSSFNILPRNIIEVDSISFH